MTDVERASCGAVEEASWRRYCGEVVPIPTLPTLLLKMAVLGFVEVAHLEFGAPSAVAKHTLFILRHPPVSSRPFANVEVATVEVATNTEAVVEPVMTAAPATESAR